MILWLFGFHRGGINEVCMVLGGVLFTFFGLLFLMITVPGYNPNSNIDKEHIQGGFAFIGIGAAFAVFGVIAGMIAVIAGALFVLYSLVKGVMIVTRGS